MQSKLNSSISFDGKASVNSEYKFEARVELWPAENGWHLARVPIKLSKPLEILADRGLIAVEATIGSSSWKTSLLPYGDGTHFIALPAKVRKKENISLDDKVKARFTLRER